MCHLYELIQLGEDTYFIDCPSRVGVVRLCRRDVCLIDSGATPEAAKRIDQLLAQNGWRVSRIINTHAHAGHCGGNAYFYEQYRCQIFAPSAEAAFARYPALHLALAYGAAPPSALCIPRLMPQPSPAAALTGTFLAPDFELYRLDGHAPAMVGVKTRDGVWFVGDAVMGEDVMREAQILQMYDAGEYLRSLEALERLEGAKFVPSHAQPTDTLLPLIIQNRVRIQAMMEFLCSLCEEPLCFDAVVKAVFDHYALTLTAEKYAVAGSSLRALLTYLCDAGRMELRAMENMMYFCTVG